MWEEETRQIISFGPGRASFVSVSDECQWEWPKVWIQGQMFFEKINISWILEWQILLFFPHTMCL